jgi:hypothetical protein
MGWVVSVSPRPRFTPGERTPGTHCTGGWVGPSLFVYINIVIGWDIQYCTLFTSGSFLCDTYSIVLCLHQGLSWVRHTVLYFVYIRIVLGWGRLYFIDIRIVLGWDIHYCTLFTSWSFLGETYSIVLCFHQDRSWVRHTLLYFVYIMIILGWDIHYCTLFTSWSFLGETYSIVLCLHQDRSWVRHTNCTPWRYLLPRTDMYGRKLIGRQSSKVDCSPRHHTWRSFCRSSGRRYWPTNVKLQSQEKKNLTLG